MSPSTSMFLRDDLWPVLTGACAVSCALLAFAAFGPRLWATQPFDNAARAVAIVATGQLLAAAIAWPAWTRRASHVVVVVAGAPVWLLLAGRVEQAELAATLTGAGRLAIAFLILGVLRAVVPSRWSGFAWCGVVVVVLAPIALRFLGTEFGSNIQLLLPMPHDFVIATFSHSR